MKKYSEHKGLDLAAVGQEILQYWKKENIFQKSISEREGAPSFTFYEGPPSANGTPGIHHVMARAVKDVFCRYKTMKGFQVKRKGGWDTHGLPVELQVEKELGITKEDIGKKITVEEYNAKCREAVMKFKGEWDDLTEKMGYWVDLKDPYITFDRKYIESLWFLLKELYTKDFLYKGYTIQPYSPAAGTGLSSHELNQPGCYRDVKDTSAVAQFKVVSGQWSVNDDVYFLAWTTTPWTLPSNSALAVGENIIYLMVETVNPYTHSPVNVILAKDLVEKYIQQETHDPITIFNKSYKYGYELIINRATLEKEFAKDEASKSQKFDVFLDEKLKHFFKNPKAGKYDGKVIQEFKGKELIGIKYEQLMPYVKPTVPAFRVIAGDFVSTEDGTGIVHIAPTFGADDARVAKQAGIPAITVLDDEGNELPLVDKRGRFVKEVTDFALEYVKEAYYTEAELETERKKQLREKYLSVDERISIKLKEENKAFKVEKYEHSYPHCWRTDKPVLYYPLDSWFIRTTAVKDRMVELNKTINWKPESTGTGRFGNWLENLIDWNLSRSRYWGTPLPIWRTEDGKEEKCIGSITELEEELNKAREAGIKNPDSIEDLHRPYVDDIVLLSGSGKPMFREKDLIDVWFDSGAMPYAQWHYPFENKDIFANNFPADFIAEGVDQTRGWFFTLHAISVMLFDKVAFKNVIANGLVLDKNGNKMSKRLGNAINPFETIGKFGPDATRWYMIVNAPPWDNLKFNIEGVAEVQRRFLGTLQNTYSFFALYSNLDGFTFSEAEIPLAKRTESDRWIISRLNTLIQSVDKSYADYEPTRAAREIQDFVMDELSNWYVRLNRKRFWKGEYNEDKQAAYQTLYTCLEAIARLSAPIAPFYTEKLFRDLNEVTGKSTSSSVHLSLFPVSNAAFIDIELEERMNLAQRISSLIHSLRKASNIKVRQPLTRALLPILNEQMKHRVQAVENLILSEVNIKTLEYIEDTSGVIVKSIKPNFKKLGKEYGAKLKELGNAIQAMKEKDILALETNNIYKLVLADGTNISITLEDVEIRSQDIPGWSVASEGNVTVALDINLTEELRQEGIARDVVNRVQNLRKDLGLDVQDKIKITIQKSDELINSALMSNKEYICEETQALTLELLENVIGATSVEMDEQSLLVKIEVQ
ncbi:MAG TPA: isoleucine--tRNA ligase [Cytophagaceae bacterium]|nr:isoleucine--tRNA ligase [Cytophagaceae bacterium]